LSAPVLKEKFAIAFKIIFPVIIFLKMWKYYERLFRVCSKCRNPGTEQNLNLPSSEI
jgi:hypothetical protein